MRIACSLCGEVEWFFFHQSVFLFSLSILFFFINGRLKYLRTLPVVLNDTAWCVDLIYKAFSMPCASFVTVHL